MFIQKTTVQGHENPTRVQIESFQSTPNHATMKEDPLGAGPIHKIPQVTFGRLSRFWCNKKEDSDETCFSIVSLTRDDFHLATDRLLMPLFKAVTCAERCQFLHLGMPFWSFSQDRNGRNTNKWFRHINTGRTFSLVVVSLSLFEVEKVMKSGCMWLLDQIAKPLDIAA